MRNAIGAAAESAYHGWNRCKTGRQAPLRGSDKEMEPMNAFRFFYFSSLMLVTFLAVTAIANAQPVAA